MRFLNKTIAVAVVLTWGLDAFAGELDAQLEQLTPDYVAPPLEVLEEPGAQSPAVALLGVSFEQSGQRLTGDRPVISNGGPLTIITHWRARLRMNSRIAGEIIFWDDLALIRVPENIRIGPAAGEAPWEVGGVYATAHTIDPEILARQFSGDASIVVAIRGPASSSRQMLPRQLLPVHVMPHVRPSGISADDILDAFGADCRFVDTFIRLGRGAKSTIPVQKDWRTGNRKLAIISSMSYRAPDQGRTVCDVVLSSGSGNKSSFALAAGKDTALRNYDALPKASRNHQRAQIFTSSDSGQVGEGGAPVRLHNYVAEFDISPELEAIDTITLSCSSSTLLDIVGIVLLP